jgi:chemotaxis protein methyltransferase CheR
MVSFKKLNLMQPFVNQGTFDIIFCRNVSIYFSQEDRSRLFNKIADMLVSDGYLIIGSSESLLGICPRLQPKRHVRSVFYQMAA